MRHKTCVASFFIGCDNNFSLLYSDPLDRNLYAVVIFTPMLLQTVSQAFPSYDFEVATRVHKCEFSLTHSRRGR